MECIEHVLDKLSNSKFRNQFHLNNQMKNYVREKGIEKIEEHAYDFIQKRLAPAYISNDGKQTPMKGHPVFVAQHATATCCRTCVEKWHHIKKGKSLSDNEVKYIVSIIMTWIKKEMEG